MNRFSIIMWASIIDAASFEIEFTVQGGMTDAEMFEIADFIADRPSVRSMIGTGTANVQITKNIGTSIDRP